MRVNKTYNFVDHVLHGTFDSLVPLALYTLEVMFDILTAQSLTIINEADVNVIAVGATAAFLAHV